MRAQRQLCPNAGEHRVDVDLGRISPSCGQENNHSGPLLLLEATLSQNPKQYARGGTLHASIWNTTDASCRMKYATVVCCRRRCRGLVALIGRRVHSLRMFGAMCCSYPRVFFNGWLLWTRPIFLYPGGIVRRPCWSSVEELSFSMKPGSLLLAVTCFCEGAGGVIFAVQLR